jgi:hypothetical protein
MKNRGQLEISFQLIFSLILIAAFLYAAIVGIKYFMNIAEDAKINSFISELQGKVESAWLTTEISQSYELALPGSIKYVCFSQPNTLTKTGLNGLNISECDDFSTYLSAFKSMNMFFCPASAAAKVGAPVYVNIDCRGQDCLQFTKSPYCIKTANGKMTVKLEKNYGEAKVTLS